MSSAVLFDLKDFRSRQPTKTWLDGRFAHLSASSLGMFRRCPRQFQQRYIHGRKEPPGEGLIVGNFFHETIGFNYQSKISTHEDRPLSELVEYLQDAAVPRVISNAGGLTEIRWDDDAHPERALDQARSDTAKMTSVYHSQVLPRMQPVAVEQKLEWHMPGVPVPIIGYLDTILADRIVDTKTGKQARSKPKPDWHLQADLYSSNIGRPIEYQTLNRKGKVVTALESPELLITPSQERARNLIGTVQKMVQQIQHMYETYGPDEDWPTWGRYADWTMNLLPCDFCGYRRDCPAWR